MTPKSPASSVLKPPSPRRKIPPNNLDTPTARAYHLLRSGASGQPNTTIHQRLCVSSLLAPANTGGVWYLQRRRRFRWTRIHGFIPEAAVLTTTGTNATKDRPVTCAASLWSGMSGRHALNANSNLGARTNGKEKEDR